MFKVTVTFRSFYNKMFNVSVLLLDYALKPATPLTNGAFSGTPRCGDFIGHKVVLRHT